MKGSFLLLVVSFIVLPLASQAQGPAGRWLDEEPILPVIDDAVVHTLVEYSDSTGVSKPAVLKAAKPGNDWRIKPVDDSVMNIAIVSVNSDQGSISDIVVIKAEETDVKEKIREQLEKEGVKGTDLSDLLDELENELPGSMFGDRSKYYKDATTIEVEGASSEQPVMRTSIAIVKNQGQTIGAQIVFDLKPHIMSADIEGQGGAVVQRPVIYFTAEGMAANQDLIVWNKKAGQRDSLLLGTLQYIIDPDDIRNGLGSNMGDKKAETDKKSDPADAGTLLYAAPDHLGVATEASVVTALLNGRYVGISPVLFSSALKTARSLEISTEDLKKAALITTLAVTAISFAANPRGAAFRVAVAAAATALGIAPVAASDVCSPFVAPEGLNYFLDMDEADQLEYVSMCPGLATAVLHLNE